MTWLRGIAVSVGIHCAAAAMIYSTAIQTEAPAEDVAAIPVELILEIESAPVMPAESSEKVVESPVEEDRIERRPVQQTASLASVKLPRRPLQQLVTKREVPIHIPAVVEEKPAVEKAKSIEVPPKIQEIENPRKVEKQKTTAKRRKQVAALAAGKGSAGKQRSTDGGAAELNYNSKVLARLRAAKKYPAAARSKGVEGTAVISFTVSSSGKLTSVKLVKGAGNALLDNAVVAMARDAAPFPAFPQTIAKNQLTFRVPVQFKLN